MEEEGIYGKAQKSQSYPRGVKAQLGEGDSPAVQGHSSLRGHSRWSLEELIWERLVISFLCASLLIDWPLSQCAHWGLVSCSW